MIVQIRREVMNYSIVYNLFLVTVLVTVSSAIIGKSVKWDHDNPPSSVNDKNITLKGSVTLLPISVTIHAETKDIDVWVKHGHTTIRASDTKDSWLNLVADKERTIRVHVE